MEPKLCIREELIKRNIPPNTSDGHCDNDRSPGNNPSPTGFSLPKKISNPILHNFAGERGNKSAGPWASNNSQTRIKVETYRTDVAEPNANGA